MAAECVGYQCHDSHGKEIPNLVMNSLVDAVKAPFIHGMSEKTVPIDAAATPRPTYQQVPDARRSRR
jgi:glutathione-independent formaldehyde dehydrogenase